MTNRMHASLQSRFIGGLAAFAATLFASQTVHATLLFADGFNYNAGGLNGSDVSPAGLSGNAWSSGSSHITVVSNNLTYAGLQDLGGNAVQNVWGVSAGSVVNTYSSVTAGSVYYSFLLDCTVAPSANQYLTALNPATGAPNGSTDALQVDIGPGSGGGFEVGLRTAGASITMDPTALLLNTTYLVVAEYNFTGSGTASLFLDPTPGGSQPTANVTLAGNGTVTSIDDIGFKAQSSTTGTTIVDSTMVGTTWADVTPLAVTTPEPSTVVLAGAGLLLLAARFRRSR
jgi:PEP-CTERM motif